MSGLMVSLAVVVAAILAVLILVFSDQPATEQVRRLRGSRGPESPRRQRASPLGFQEEARVIRRPPPPANVLQRQLALPPTRPRRPVQAGMPAPSGPAGAQSRPEAAHVAPPVLTPTATFAFEDDRTFLSRLRSTVALLVLLTLVGAAVALLIGAVLFLIGLAIQNTVA